MKKTPHIWFIAPFPPPLSGQSQFNAMLRSHLDGVTQTYVLPTGGSAAGKILRAIINPLTVFLRIRRGDIVYTSAPGQLGLWLFLPTIAALRLRRHGHFVHHHSYRAVNLAPMAAHRWLARIGGQRQRHVFLCEKMRRGYVRAYLSPAQAEASLVVPNAFFFAGALPPSPDRRGPIVVGHLSVMTREKGVDYILGLQRRLAGDSSLTFVLAGPIVDDGLRSEVEAAVAASKGQLRWIGPVIGADKAAFYAGVDLFLLPTRLVDEADPLVLLEAFGAGSRVLAADRGCIAERIGAPDDLLSLDPTADADCLRRTAAEIAVDRPAAVRACQARARALHDAAKIQGEAFLAALEGRS